MPGGCWAARGRTRTTTAALDRAETTCLHRFPWQPQSVTSLRRDGDVLVLDLADANNDNPDARINPDWVSAVNAALDEVEASTGPAALVTTGSGRFYCAGLDIDWITTHPDEQDPLVEATQHLLARLLTFPMITVAAMQAHTFAAGGMVAMAHDIRLQGHRALFCLPEVDLGIVFEPGMAALLQARLPVATAHEAMLTGRRYRAADAVAGGIAHESASADELQARALARARALTSKRGPVLAANKRCMYATTLAALTDATVPEHQS